MDILSIVPSRFLCLQFHALNGSLELLELYVINVFNMADSLLRKLGVRLSLVYMEVRNKTLVHGGEYH